MKVARARVVRAGVEPVTPVPALAAAGRLPKGRRTPGVHLQAETHAQGIVARAEQTAHEIVAAAERVAAETRLRAETEARADAAARVAALAVALATREARCDEEQLTRTIELAVVLAERLLGEALGVDPQRVAALARQALREVGTARRVTIVAHPEDAAVLLATLQDLATPDHSVAIESDPARARGSLRLQTEYGVLDAELAPQLERLALRLRESLRGWFETTMQAVLNNG